MAQQLSVLAVVDVKAALQTGSLTDNYYLADNNFFGGSTGQGTPRLVSSMLSSQVLNWAVLPVAMLDPDLPLPFITRIEGPAVEQRIMIPSEYDSPDLYSDGRYWSGTIVPGQAGTFEYTLVIELRDTSQSAERNAAPPREMTITAAICIMATEEMSTPQGARLLAAASGGVRP